MTEQPLTKAKAVAGDRRTAERSAYRTRGTVFTWCRVDRSVVPAMQDAWTVDISTTGARIITNEQLDTSVVWMQFVLPAHSGRTIECDVIRKIGETPESRFRGRQCEYGVRFRRVLSDEEFLALAGSPLVAEHLAERATFAAANGTQRGRLSTAMHAVFGRFSRRGTDVSAA